MVLQFFRNLKVSLRFLFWEEGKMGNNWERNEEGKLILKKLLSSCFFLSRQKNTQIMVNKRKEPKRMSNLGDGRGSYNSRSIVDQKLISLVGRDMPNL